MRNMELKKMGGNLLYLPGFALQSGANGSPGAVIGSVVLAIVMTFSLLKSKHVRLTARKVAINLALLMPLLALFALPGLAAPGEIIEGIPITRASLQLAGIMFAVSVFARGFALLMVPEAYPWRIVLGSLGSAGMAGAGTVLLAMEQLKSPYISILLAVGAGYAGGGAVLKSYAKGARDLAINALPKEPES